MSRQHCNTIVCRCFPWLADDVNFVKCILHPGYWYSVLLLLLLLPWYHPEHYWLREDVHSHAIIIVYHTICTRTSSPQRGRGVSDTNRGCVCFWHGIKARRQIHSVVAWLSDMYTYEHHRLSVPWMGVSRKPSNDSKSRCTHHTTARYHIFMQTLTFAKSLCKVAGSGLLHIYIHVAYIYTPYCCTTYRGTWNT